MAESELGKVIAFYSYKGGTGRTMALANVGCALARDPKIVRPVLLVDWDLEAPGLHRYFRKQVIAAFNGDEALYEQAPGLIDLFLELRNHVMRDGDLSKPEQDFEVVRSLLSELPLAHFIVKTDIPRLHLLKAGRFDDSYAANIASFPWPELYHRSPYLLRSFADRLAQDYSFVLIDSRTGLTDTSGICAMLMPEVLVAVFTPNRQSLFGVIDLVHEAARYRARSDDLRPLMVYPLPSRIDALEPTLRQSWRLGDSSIGVPGFQGLFERAFKEIYDLPACDLSSYFDDVQIQHVPSYAYGEEIAVLVEETRDRFSLTQSYLRFTARLMKGDAAWVNSSSVEETADDQILLRRRVPVESGWRWCLSCNSKDQALAQALSTAIRRMDPLSIVSFGYLRDGGSWSAQSANEIAEANAFVLLVGQHGLSSWQELEYYEALDRRTTQPHFPVVLVLLDGEAAPGLPFLRQLHWILTADAASEKTVTQLMDAAAGAGAPARELWRHTAPYRGLSAMTEADVDYFFGRGRETVEVIEALAAAHNKLPVLLGNSGVGKSSVAQAGVLAALMRQSWPETATATKPWPQALSDSRRWCFLKLRPGTEPLRALVESFLGNWQFDVVGLDRAKHLAEWTGVFFQGRAALSDLIDATQRRLEDRGQAKPPVFLVYVDQGEELYVRAEERQRHRFAEILVGSLGDPRLRVMMSMRSDFLGYLQSDKPLFAARQQIDVPPLREEELREVVSRPAELLSARFEGPEMVDIITRRTAEDSAKDVGALPLLSYTLDDMWTEMVRRGDGTLRLHAQSFELGGVLVDRANKFLATHPGAEAALRRIFTLRCATVREDGEPTRRRASRAEFSDEEWRLVSELAGYPNRLLVTVVTVLGETYAEVAHDAIFRRWDRLREWIAAEREFLAWRSGLEAARRAWQAAPDRSKNDALLMGHALAQGQSWRTKRAEDIPAADRAFILQSRIAARQRKLRVQALVGVLVAALVAGAAAWWNQDWLNERVYVMANVTPLKTAQERALKPKDLFKECSDCPAMIVVPAGSFMMGSPDTEKGRIKNEGPQHKVTIAKPFAVASYELTFAEWDACVAHGACVQGVSDSGWGHARQPVINVSWDDAREYVAWLSRVTAKSYRLLSEAEYEYATRAGTQTAFPWGNEIGRNNANCNGCGSQWDSRQPAPVGSFAPNAFGLYDMVGNVFEWVEDCYHDTYEGAPTDGSAWVQGDCIVRVARGGSWFSRPDNLRSAYRLRNSITGRADFLGFRIGRTLVP